VNSEPGDPLQESLDLSEVDDIGERVAQLLAPIAQFRKLSP
jgi:hypothetical protein